MSDLEELTEEQKKKIKVFYPPFVAKKMIELTDEINNQIPTHIDDFYNLHLGIWKISSKSYQEEIWGKRGQWGDNFMETMENFLEDSEAVLKANDAERVSMELKQREMLQELYDKIDWFLEDPEAPYSEYGEEDDKVINDPNWQKIGKYARKVYEELSGDDLDEWEKQRAKDT